MLASLFASDTFLNAGQTYSSLHFCPLCWQKSLTFFLLKKATRPFCVQQILFLTNALWFEELNNDAEGDKHIETCGCCGSGLEDEHSKHCDNVFYHGGNDGATATVGLPSMVPSMNPSYTGKGKGGKRKNIRQRRNKRGDKADTGW